jgi:hypothetical protein
MQPRYVVAAAQDLIKVKLASVFSTHSAQLIGQESRPKSCPMDDP